MKRFKLAFLFCFSMLLLIPLAFTTLQEDAVSQLDNRMLAKIPVSRRLWITQGENFLRDRIGFRDDFILFYRQAMYRLFNVFEHPRYTLGSNGHLYLIDATAIEFYQSLYDSTALGQIKDKLEILHQYLKSKNKHLLFVQMPMKQNVYPEFVPSYIHKGTKPLLSAALDEALKDSGIPHIYLADVLRRYRAIAPTFHQKFDPQHYTAVGAFVAHEAIAHELQKLYPNYPIPLWSDFHQSSLKENLAMYFLHTEEEEVPVLQRISRDFDIKHLKDDLLDINISTNQNAPIKKALFLIGDSFLYDKRVYYSEQGALDYYGHAFEKVYLIPLAEVKNIYTLIERYQPDIILYETVEWMLQNHFRFNWTQPS